MLKSIIGQMGRHIDKLNDTERGLIDRAVNQVWEAKGRGGCVDDVIEALGSDGSVQGTDLAIAMFPFSGKGTYGSFFTGEASVDMSNALTVFELSDLSSREELRSVVLTAIMFMSQQMMRKVHLWGSLVPQRLLCLFLRMKQDSPKKGYVWTKRSRRSKRASSTPSRGLSSTSRRRLPCRCSSSLARTPRSSSLRCSTHQTLLQRELSLLWVVYHAPLPLLRRLLQRKMTR